MSLPHLRADRRRPTRGTVGAVLGAACALSVGVSAAPAASTTALKAALKGSNETGPGDTDGRGTATVRIKGTRLCYSLSLAKVVTTGGHVHRGGAGTDGPIVATFYNGKEDRKGCLTVSSTLAKQIVKQPSAFYVNLHNEKFPEGAVRGQLRKG